jgi:hypothetical protein
MFLEIHKLNNSIINLINRKNKNVHDSIINGETTINLLNNSSSYILVPNREEANGNNIILGNMVKEYMLVFNTEKKKNIVRIEL